MHNQKALALKASTAAILALLFIEESATTNEMLFIDKVGPVDDVGRQMVALKMLNDDIGVMMILGDVEATAVVSDLSSRINEKRAVLLIGNLTKDERKAVYAKFGRHNELDEAIANKLAYAGFGDYGHEARELLGALDYIGIIVDKDQLPTAHTVMHELEDDARLVDLTALGQNEDVIAESRELEDDAAMA